MFIKVPATSANVGCGFDSMGFAVNLYLEVEVVGASEKWEVLHELGPGIPTDEQNLIVETALKIAPGLKPHRLRVKNEVPVERGLGSSSTALVAGIELADRLGGLKLGLEDKLQLACQAEGHPDNVAPAILGGFVVANYDEGQLSYAKFNLYGLGLVAFVPNKKMSTEEMRKILPGQLSFKDAVRASAVSNTMLAHLLNRNFEEAGKLIEKDLLHEPYRKQLLPELDAVRSLGKNYEAYATYLSGSGSTIMTMLPKNRVQEFYDALSQWEDAQVFQLEIISLGLH
ncbi:MAG: homoserine kinase [Turicibacter sp.]|nr:homoserine kinase [Turicibacter sp.]